MFYLSWWMLYTNFILRFQGISHLICPMVKYFRLSYQWNWAQLAHSNLKPFLYCNAELIFNFDDTVYFPNTHYISSFYKDVFSCYNKTFVKSRDEFISCITDEYLWGNKFFVKCERGKTMVLFLRNWIRSGVNKVRDLSFVDGKLNMDLMYDIIEHKGNIYSEILTIREALLPYQEYLKDDDRVAYVLDFNPKRSKDFYIQFRNMLAKDIPIASNYLCKYCTSDDLTFVFRTKLVAEKEMKLKEFNFKFTEFCHVIVILKDGSLELLIHVMCVRKHKVLNIYCGNVIMWSLSGRLWRRCVILR